MVTNRLAEDMLDIEIRNAVLRAWCHPSTEHIEPDPTLVAAIVSEVNHYVRVRLRQTHQPLPPQVEAAVSGEVAAGPSQPEADKSEPAVEQMRMPMQQGFPKQDPSTQQRHGGF